MSNNFIDHAEDSMGAAIGNTNNVKDKASALVQQGIDVARDTSNQVRESALQATDRTVAYIRHEPVKAMLIAVGTGAALVMLAKAFGTSSRDR